MRVKNIIWYALYFVLFVGIVVMGDNVMSKMWKYAQQMNYHIVPSVITSTLYYFIVGNLIGLPSFARKISKKGKLQLNKEKLLVIGVPTVIVPITNIFYFFISLHNWPNTHVPFWIEWVPHIIYFGTPIYNLTVILLGYTLITGFNKKEFSVCNNLSEC